MHCVVEGIPLPRLGSFKYHVLEEGLTRKRAERTAFATFFAGLLGSTSGLEGDAVQLLVTTYAETVHQARYNYRYTPARQRRLEERLSKQQEDMRILDKVNAMTVEDED